MHKATTRAVRTVSQVALAEAIILLLVAPAISFWFKAEMTNEQYAAAILLLSTVITWVQNVGETKGWWGVLAGPE